MSESRSGSDAPAARLATAPILWALLGVGLLFGTAAWRLGQRGIATMRAGLGPWEWSALAALTALFVYGEGIRALERRYAPWLIDRITRLPDEPRPVYRLLAPLYALALIGARRGTVARAWGGSAAIALAVLIVRAFPEPWRGITDFAVAAALVWGLVAILREAKRRLA